MSRITDQEVLDLKNQLKGDLPDAGIIDPADERTAIGRVADFFKARYNTLVDALTGKSDVGHTHAIGDVANLQTTLNSHNSRISDNASSIALRVKQIKQGTTTYSPDANGLVTLPETASGADPKAIDVVLSFQQLQVYNLVYPAAWKITAISTNAADVTATVTLGATATAYTPGSQVAAWASLDISVNKTGVVRLIGTLL